MSAKHAPYRAAHFKATLNGTAGAQTTYACVLHEGQLREQAEDRALVLALSSQERDSAGTWCSFCSLQGDTGDTGVSAHLKETE